MTRGARPESGFTIVANDVLRDTRLSLRARGLLLLVLTYPDDWRVSSAALARQVPEGRNAVRACLKELELAGYLVRRKTQDPQTGHWSTELVVYDRTPARSRKTAGRTVSDAEIRIMCGWRIAWHGRCSTPVSAPGERCNKHVGKTCAGCDQPATGECDFASQFVCGFPLCDACDHHPSGYGHGPRLKEVGHAP